MENNRILDGLNSEQRNAVSCVEGPVLIVAGAGSGKTRVLTSRIAYILQNGGNPKRILALTFTKKAASEMKERIALMVGERKAIQLRMGTFHSVFIRFLREYAGFLGYPTNFTIYDSGDSVSAVKACIKQLGLDEKVYKPKEVLSRISMAKNNLVTASDYAKNASAKQNDTKSRKPMICDIYKLYAANCRNSGVMDFDDILLNMFLLLKGNKEALESISSRFDYIMVDEYQDTNYAQYVILKALARTHRNICVVGDDSQSIYAFRGAKIENILNFRRDYPENRTFRLEQNYRSTRTIVDAANTLIAHNVGRIPKNCYSMGDEGEKIRLIKSFTETEEAIMIVSSIMANMRNKHAEYKDFAILYRTNSQSRAIEEVLRRRNIPYMIYSGNSFFERAEVKDLMAYFKLAVNPNDDESFKRIVNKPARGIGDTTISALTAAAHRHGCPLMRATYLEDLPASGLKNGAIIKLREFGKMMAALTVKSVTQDAYSLARAIASESGLLLFYKSDTSIEGQAKAANVEELIDSVKIYVEERHSEDSEQIMTEKDIADEAEVPETDLPVVTLADYLENVSLLSSVDVDAGEDAANRVALMTVHSSKGLEFPYVYVSGMEENLFPSGGILAAPNEVEEERRLFYVAVTRAEKFVCLSFADTRMRNGKHESNAPSRFLKEIDSQYYENPSLLDNESFEGFSFGGSKTGPERDFSRYGNVPKSAPRQQERRTSGITPVRRPNVVTPVRVPDSEFVPTPILELRAGQRIEHNRFGFGIILEITVEKTDRKAKIRFDEFGEKTILLKYAKIRVVDVAK